jgi:acyl-CoA synthetase (AMP-forming)/AMP-acid ligase II
LTFAIFKSGAINVLIDPGMGRSNIFECLEEIKPDGFVAIPPVQIIRKLNSKRFPTARFNVTVGRKLGWDGLTYKDLLEKGNNRDAFPITKATDPAAIIFTSGSTGPPKGVLYEHGMFNAQVNLLRDFYGIQPGEVDLSGFPLFALFNSAMGVTTVIPDMNPTKPALVDPVRFLEAIHANGVTQAFGSPALWNRVGRYCEKHFLKIPSLRRVLSAGAPVPVHVIKRMKNALIEPSAEIFTPYGATESLPVASISGRRVLESTAAKTAAGAGTCVGQRFPEMTVRIIEITDGPIRSTDHFTELPSGEIGEIIVKGPSVTREYYRRPDATAATKILDGDSFWHRMGDVGYIDQETDDLWFCGRKTHIVDTSHGRMFTICCEAIFNQHPHVYRSALVGVGEKPDERPVIIVEPGQDHFPSTREQKMKFRDELLELGQRNELTRSIEVILFHRSLPVDIRHNVKISREKLRPWAVKQLQKV